MNLKMLALALAALLAGAVGPSSAQMTPGQRVAPLGYCQLSASQLSSSIGLSACVRASFTATGSGVNLTASSVTGIIKVGDTVAGTGVPAGTTIVSQTSGTTGGAGVYVTSAATTSIAASLTSGGIPAAANVVVMQAEVASVRYRDDGGAPTTSIGGLVVSGLAPMTYTGTLSALRFIGASGSPLLDVSFYKSP